jgi:hypothetical protein
MKDLEGKLPDAEVVITFVQGLERNSRGCLLSRKGGIE